MHFGLKFVSIVSIAGVFAWAASAAPLQPLGNDQNQDFGYGYGAAKVTLCHIPPGNPGNAHTITVGAPAVPAHLGHGDTLGPCPDVLVAATAGTQEKKNHDKGKSKQDEEPTTESTTTTNTSTTPTEQSGAPGEQQKPKKEHPGHSNGASHGPAPTTTTDTSSPGNGNGNGNGNGGGNGKANGHDK